MTARDELSKHQGQICARATSTGQFVDIWAIILALLIHLYLIDGARETESAAICVVEIVPGRRTEILNSMSDHQRNTC
jgi:hypothetical protein